MFIENSYVTIFIHIFSIYQNFSEYVPDLHARHIT